MANNISPQNPFYGEYYSGVEEKEKSKNINKNKDSVISSVFLNIQEQELNSINYQEDRKLKSDMNIKTNFENSLEIESLFDELIEDDKIILNIEDLLFTNEIKLVEDESILEKNEDIVANTSVRLNEIEAKRDDAQKKLRGFAEIVYINDDLVVIDDEFDIGKDQTAKNFQNDFVMNYRDLKNQKKIKISSESFNPVIDKICQIQNDSDTVLFSPRHMLDKKFIGKKIIRKKDLPIEWQNDPSLIDINHLSPNVKFYKKGVMSQEQHEKVVNLVTSYYVYSAQIYIIKQFPIINSVHITQKDKQERNSHKTVDDHSMDVKNNLKISNENPLIKPYVVENNSFENRQAMLKSLIIMICEYRRKMKKKEIIEDIILLEKKMDLKKEIIIEYINSEFIRQSHIIARTKIYDQDKFIENIEYLSQCFKKEAGFNEEMMKMLLNLAVRENMLTKGEMVIVIMIYVQKLIQSDLEETAGIDNRQFILAKVIGTVILGLLGGLHPGGIHG